MARTGLQREVLALYKDFLRAVQTKPQEAQGRFKARITSQFRHDAATVSRRDFGTIEYLVRRGRKQLELLRSEGVVDISA
ncbi:hypothetical protein BC831DRAFT_478017 [Entophlyctis helioformis]|nr:hypothetical protein BC831DRAFT_478017 [Entophlyctis helioformis]